MGDAEREYNMREALRATGVIGTETIHTGFEPFKGKEPYAKVKPIMRNGKVVGASSKDVVVYYFTDTAIADNLFSNQDKIGLAFIKAANIWGRTIKGASVVLQTDAVIPFGLNGSINFVEKRIDGNYIEQTTNPDIPTPEDLGTIGKYVGGGEFVVTDEQGREVSVILVDSIYVSKGGILLPYNIVSRSPATVSPEKRTELLEYLRNKHAWDYEVGLKKGVLGTNTIIEEIDGITESNYSDVGSVRMFDVREENGLVPIGENGKPVPKKMIYRRTSTPQRKDGSVPTGENGKPVPEEIIYILLYQEQMQRKMDAIVSDPKVEDLLHILSIGGLSEGR